MSMGLGPVPVRVRGSGALGVGPGLGVPREHEGGQLLLQRDSSQLSSIECVSRLSHADP